MLSRQGFSPHSQMWPRGCNHRREKMNGIDLSMEALDLIEAPEVTTGEVLAALGGLAVGIGIGVLIAT